MIIRIISFDLSLWISLHWITKYKERFCCPLVHPLEDILQVLSNACQSSCSAVATEQCWIVNRRSQIGASAVRLGGTKYQPTKGLDNNVDDQEDGNYQKDDPVVMMVPGNEVCDLDDKEVWKSPNLPF